MFRLGLLFVTILFLIGCTTKKEDSLLKSYTEKIDYHKQLQKTEKVQLYDNNDTKETKVVLMATYLYTPNFEKDDSRDEVFIVGVSFEDDDTNDSVSIFGIRDSDDIKEMREKETKKKEEIEHSIFDQIINSVGLGDDLESNIKIKEKNKKASNTVAKDEKKKNIKDSNTTEIHYGLTLNAKNAIAIKKLNVNDERLKHLSFITEWGSYYLVTFEHTKKKRFKLVFHHEAYGKGMLHFSKVAKYVYTKKGF